MVYYLVRKGEGRQTEKAVHILDQKGLSALSAEAVKILRALAQRPASPMQLAHELGMHEQKVYYHIKKLRAAGMIEEAGTEQRRGTICHFYTPTAPAFAFEIAKTESETRPDLLERFFHEFVKDGTFDGLIVVGSPWPHGPFRTAARDGHYAVQLAGMLGNLCIFKGFAPRLDVEITEKELRQNLILIGGPVTNMITDRINRYLPARFEWKGQWQIVAGGKMYRDKSTGLITKIASPFEPKRRIVLLAGLSFEATRRCIEAVAAPSILKRYQNIPFYEIIK
ncbi:MAG: helix-turn-helix domain-containing protein [Candidatus Aenigmatarchaeota archaeon]